MAGPDRRAWSNWESTLIPNSKRGGSYVAVQLGLMAWIVWGPKNLAATADWIPPWSAVVTLFGVALVAAGGGFIVVATAQLGSNLTPFPRPRAGGTLVQSGAYRLVRHPIYSGIVVSALGWALFVHGALTLVYVVLLFLFFDFKTRQEGRWLSETFHDYVDYQGRVRKLIPFIY